jgi:hypothetical protein
MSGLLALAARVRRLEAERRARATTGESASRLDAYRTDPSRVMREAGYEPDDWQRDLLRSDAARVLMLTCRQAGKSTTAGFLALREAFAQPGATVLVVSSSQRQSAELVRRVTDAINHLGRPLPIVAESVLALTFANRSRVIALPASEAGIRGFTAAMVILDEAARLPEPIIAAVRPMLAVSGGKLVALSTPFAKRGFLFEQWMGEEPWVRAKVTANMCPRITREFLEEERRILGSRGTRWNTSASSPTTSRACSAPRTSAPHSRTRR